MAFFFFLSKTDRKFWCTENFTLVSPPLAMHSHASYQSQVSHSHFPMRFQIPFPPRFIFKNKYFAFPRTFLFTFTLVPFMGVVASGRLTLEVTAFLMSSSEVAFLASHVLYYLLLLISELASVINTRSHFLPYILPQ